VRGVSYPDSEPSPSRVAGVLPLAGRACPILSSVLAICPSHPIADLNTRAPLPNLVASVRLDFTPAKLTTLLGRFLADRQYGPSIIVLIGPQRFAREVLHEPEYAPQHVFRQMRELVRSLVYDDSLHSIERRILIDESGRKWSVTTVWRRRWYIIAEPYDNVRGKNHEPEEDEEPHRSV